jgi:antitoxin ParD1/3/4
MNVSLTPELEQLVNEKVKSGLYQTASEVVREALRLLKERDDHASLRADIQAGLDQLARGQGRDYDEESGRPLADRVKARGRAALASKRR